MPTSLITKFTASDVDLFESCGHFTQMAWAETTEIGCAVQNCPNQGSYLVCRYNPPFVFFIYEKID